MPTKDDDAREAWSCMLRMLVGGEHQQRLARAADEAGLTLRQLHALFDLDPDNPRPMRDLAVEWYCDASNVTGIVDGLEAIGMVERLPSKVDRRVKLIRLTDVGSKARADCIEKGQVPPDGFGRLNAAETRTLRSLLARVSEGYQWPQERPVEF